jgi:hypothetical protein
MIQFLKYFTWGIIAVCVFCIYCLSHRVSVEYVDITIMSQDEDGRYIVWADDKIQVVEDKDDWIFFKKDTTFILEPGETYLVKLAGAHLSLHSDYKNIVQVY